MKFERFESEYSFDFLILGEPHAFETADSAAIDYPMYHYYNYYFTYDIDYLRTGKALILDRSQPTGIWTTAKRIDNFDIYFHRMVLKTS